MKSKIIIKRAFFVVLFLCSLIMGCIILDVFDDIETEPKQLPKAIVGKPYSVDVELLGIILRSIFVEINPQDALNWEQKTKHKTQYLETEYSFRSFLEKYGYEAFLDNLANLTNTITIYGTPNKKGVITVKFFGADYPTMWSSSKEIETTRKIIVEE